MKVVSAESHVRMYRMLLYFRIDGMRRIKAEMSVLDIRAE